MTNSNPKLYSQASLVGVASPAAVAVGSASSGWISAKAAFSYMAIISAGILGTAGTLDAKIEQATDSGGTGVKDVTGKAITQLVKATNDDDQAVINLKQQDLDIGNDFTHFRVTLTVGGATSEASAHVIAAAFRHGNGEENDLASVVEVV